MPLLTPGNSVTLTLTDYDSVTVQAWGVATLTANSGLGVTAGKIAEVSGLRTFGPFMAGSMTLSSVGGPCFYEVADGVAPVAPGNGSVALNALPSKLAISNSAADTIAVVINGAPSIMSMDAFVSALGVSVTDLASAGALSSTDVMTVVQADGAEKKVTLSALATYFGAGSGGSVGAGDTTAPTMNGSLTSSGVTQTAATVTWVAASDAVGVTGYEVSKDGGTTYTNVNNVLTYQFTGLTAGTTYPVRVRAYDVAGNKATPLSLSVTTASSADATAPTMSGSLTTTNVTASGYTMNWTAGSDNVAVTGYETSTDGGTTWSDAGNVISRAITGASASTLYNIRVRAYDAAGNRSNVLSATVTTSAASGNVYTITPYTNGNTIRTSLSLASATNTFSPLKQFLPGQMMTTTATYWNFSPAVSAGTNVRCGWSLSNVTPPAEITSAANTLGNTSVNGLVPMTARTSPSWENNANLWVPESGASGPWYFWMRIGTEDQCLNAGNGLMVS